MSTAPLPANVAEGPETDLRDEIRTIRMVWLRELIRFARTRTRILSGLIQPILFLLVLGYGLNGLVGSTGGFDFKKFMFPGIMAMSVVTTAIFSGMSIVWDREFGFLREMLVAPTSRASLALGKTAGGATVAAAQGTIMLILAPLIGVRLTALLVIEIIGLELLMAITMTAFGVAVATRIQKMEGFQVVMQMLLFPMIFLSGALFPLSGLPGWLEVLTRIDPLTYAVAPLRQVVFAAQNMPAAARKRFASTIELFGHTLSIGTEIAIVVAFAVIFIALAIRGFSRTE